VELGCISRGHGEKPTLGITPRGSAVLRGGETIDVDVRAAPPVRAVGGRKSASAFAPALALTPEVSATFEALRSWRLEVARSTEVPPYVVFHDRTLAEIAQRRPENAGALATIPGVGPAKLERYGNAVLAVLRDGKAASTID
jgi:ATP-dependent DNA helicase RecQ